VVHAFYSLALLPAFLLLCLQGLAMADTITGYLDYIYRTESSTAKDSSGQSTNTESNNFLQQYYLLMDKTIYPKLTLSVAATFKKDRAKSTIAEQRTDSTNTTFAPYATLTLKDPLYMAQVGYYLRENTFSASRAPTFTLVNEEYDALLGWKPVGLPRWDMRFTKTNTYDRDRTTLDVTKDYYSLNSQHAYKGLDLRYFGTYVDSRDRLHNVETEELTHYGRGTYTNTFFNGRVSFSTTYNYTRNDTTISTAGAGAGTVPVQLFPTGGLSAVSNTTTPVVLDPNPFLIDGNLTATSGLNIGLPPLGGDTRPRSAGLDFSTPTQVNSLLVWVDRELPTDIAASFSWDIYTSSDNLNWTFLNTVSSAPFGPFQNRFEIGFSDVSARYIRVVVRPLQPTVIGADLFPNILVTELQAFAKVAASVSRKQEFTSTTQISNTELKYRILDRPLLYYDFSYYFLDKDQSPDTDTLSNGLSVSYQFSRIFTGAARVAREEGKDRGAKRTAYVYNGSITATPLRTLTNTFVFSGREEEVGGESRSAATVFLNNTAALYKGLDVNLNGGYTSSTETDGSKVQSTVVTLGANVVPHRTTTLTLYVTDTRTDQSRPGQESFSTGTRQAELTAAYNPFSTLYLLGSLQVVNETGQGTDRGYRTLQNYGLNWSPFPYGDLQFRFSYNESRNSREHSTDRTISPGLRYKINDRSFLDVSYQSIRSEAASQSTDSDVFTMNLKIFFAR
jgi:hypothetical protein